MAAERRCGVADVIVAGLRELAADMMRASDQVLLRRAAGLIERLPSIEPVDLTTATVGAVRVTDDMVRWSGDTEGGAP